jgi:hypothetical protein
VDLEHEPDAVIRAGRRDDLLALLAIRLGFHPSESLLLGCVEGPRSRLGFVARVDLPERVSLHQQVAALARVFRAQAAERVVVVAVGRGAGLDAIVDETVQALTAVDVDVVEALVADGKHWWCRLCPAGTCGDARGTPYDLTSSPALAQAVLAGVSVLPSRTALADSFAAVPGERRADVTAAVDDVRASLRRYWRRHGGERPLHRTPAVLATGAARVRRLLEQATQESAPEAYKALTGPHLSSGTIAELAVLADLAPVRDVAWSLITRASAREHAALWAQVARHAPVELSAAPLALAGFASWLHGDGAAAWCAVERCLREHPDYSMGLLLAEALHRALPPDRWSPPPQALVDAGLHPEAVADHPPRSDRPADDRPEQ